MKRSKNEVRKEPYRVACPHAKRGSPCYPRVLVSVSSGERARRSVAYYRFTWGAIQIATALLVFLGKEIILHASRRGFLRRWLYAMLNENTVIEQIRESSIHVLGFRFHLLDATWILLLLGVLNIVFGWLILRTPYRARMIGMVVFGIGFLIGTGSVILHPTLVRLGLTVLDLVFFSYFAWILPRSLLPALAEIEEGHHIDKNEKTG